MATAKSPIAAPSSHNNHDRGYGPTGYFPQQPQPQPQPQLQQQPQQHYHHQQQQQQQQPLQPGGADSETVSNTLANSQVVPQPDYAGHLVAPVATRPTKFTEEWDSSQRGTSIVDGPSTGSNMQRSSSLAGSVMGVTGDGSSTLSRGNTLKKKASLRRGGSLKRSSSRRSMKAGSVRSLALQSATDQDEVNSAFFCPVPTSGNPTEVLANRFQAWRKILKDLITYFREIQSHYEHRAKSLLKLSNVLNNTTTPPGFLASGGLDDALQILRNYNKLAVVEANKAREIEEDVILALTGLRSDLHQKIKEIKNLSGDFKNSVEKEMDSTRRVVNHLQDILGQAELDTALTTGKQDPYLLRLAVDRQLEKQIDEENYLHQAYLNLENSGRELESIVVGEIQKSYNAYAGILKRESEAAYSAIEELRVGPISMPKDTEWNSFVQRDDHFVDPDVSIRSAEFIHYPGRDHYACQEIRAGLLERKSKYLKSYTAGWYVLSPTHLHEFKSADKTQAPVMSLYLPEQKLGSHSTEGGSSNKFILKGRQTGSMHRGHTWVFRAESHDTMMAWYEDIKTLTEQTPEERNNFVRVHGRSVSRSSQRSSVSSDGVDDDEDPPFAASSVVSVSQPPRQDTLPRRPSGGRFPSDLQVNAQRGLQVPLSPVSVSSGFNENSDGDAIAAAGALPGSGYWQHYNGQEPNHEHGNTSGTHRDEHNAVSSRPPYTDGLGGEPPKHPRPANNGHEMHMENQDAGAVIFGAPQSRSQQQYVIPSDSLPRDQQYGDNEATWGGTTQSRQVLDGANGMGDVPPVSKVQTQGSFPRASAGNAHVGRQEAGVMETGAGGAALVEKDKAYGRMDGFALEDKVTARPAGGAVRNDSAPTISHLHIPGEYPRGPAA
ncbi:hypothetical protein B0T17DRAFT_113314 [Bombardia bombarda]|uniref:PH domain-containing protein n=1 Tax=Bombardia bombarda TaxID=252184 RepID=A0AA39W9T6_9PEZI|nr:hypothetical protein B0T17DRAFT_113314 [Bombardia bombarda]